MSGSTLPALEWDLLVIANPVWETAWLLPELPPRAAVDFDPRPSALATAEDGGGSALNTACALACAGRRVTAVGRVGDDDEGRAAIAALERRGITSRIEIARGRTTKRNHLYVSACEGGRAVAFRAFLPPGCAPAWEETPREIMRARLLLLDRLAARAPDWLHARDRPRFLNAFNRNSPAFRKPAIERFEEALPFIDYLQTAERPAESAHRPPAAGEEVGPQTREAVHSPPDAPPLGSDEIAAILGAGVGILARTRGACGVILHRSGSAPVEIPAVETEVLDPTGAGDAFAAGFLDLLLDGVDVVAAARRGVDWGSRACRHLGARAWLDREPPERR